MEKIKTIQTKENLNTIHPIGKKGSGGAYHDYKICQADTREAIEWIEFQNGARKDENSTTGVLDSDLLEIVKHRLECFQEGPFHCNYNAEALRCLTEALEWMNKRVEDRISRGVLGVEAK